MAKANIADRPYYVYILFREDGETPFYVGMGKGSRWLDHERHVARARNHKNNIILQIMESGLSDVPKRKVAEGMSKSEAQAEEIRLIASIGRFPSGPLVNLTDGGEGLLGMSQETIDRRTASFRSYLQTEEGIAMLSELQRKAREPANRAFRLERLREAYKRPDVRQKSLDNLAAIAASAADKERKRLLMIESWKDPEMRAKYGRAKGIKRGPMPQHVRDALVKANTGRKQTQEHIDSRFASRRKSASQ